jgi:hypothetical protein
MNSVPKIAPPGKEQINPNSALARSCGASPTPFQITTAPAPETGAGDTSGLVSDFNLTTDAANFILADVECPIEHRPFIDALIGVAGQRNDDWFKASDKTVAARMGRSAKTVARHRDDLEAWQRANKITFVEIQDQYTDADGKRHPHRYRVHLSRLAVETVLDAQTSAQWRMNPGVAMADAARAKRDSLPDMPSRTRRGKKREPDAEAMIAKNLKTAATLIKKAADMREAVRLRGMCNGTDADCAPDAQLLSNVQRELERLFNPGGGNAPDPVSTNKETLLVDTPSGTAGVMDTPPCVPDARPGGLTPSGQNVRKETVHDDATVAARTFESVGAVEFGITIKDELTRVVGDDDYEVVTNLDAWLDGCLRRNEAGSESFIVRPRGGVFVQIDDVDRATIARLEPFAFLVVETSSDNYQVWVCLPEGTSEITRAELRERLVRGVGGDIGASGALRWPGSINHKPGREGFRVRVVATNPGRTVTTDELEQAGLLAAPSRLTRQADERSRREAGASRPSRFPDYQRCMSDKGGDRSRADASFLKTAVLWGWSMGEAVMELERVSARVQEETARGRRDYLARVVKLVGH